ncbi:alkaline phosphatase [Paracidovorax avenae]|uniref:PhoX family protein n=1 Tax=Paracidovorax avenae TaxID=80867 RepID=UPI000D172252|nr:alkaline phosphatase PhoX [Paracidovorax avenae]AVS85638.1 alkaline phosphatase [Paracidovorax avenae]AVS89153.1 alkaline phosphatase [Paracidovorax avenae]AVT03377.1 alkaline phosphatase [Paracidovorax avenae]
MSHTPMPSRRKALQFLAGMPLLPLGATASAASVLAACGGGSGGITPPNFASASFTSMAAPTLATPAAMATTTVGSTLNVKFSDDSTQSYQLAYQPFFITGDRVSDGKGGTILAGGYVDINNQPIIDTTVAGKERQFFSDSPDGTSLLTVPNAKVDGVKGNPVFAVVQFEYTTWAQDGKTDMYGKLPSPIAVLSLDQDPATGKLTLVKYHNVDTSKVHGLWITCGASLSPWGTHLSSEEYEPDAFTAASNAQFKAYSKNLYGSETAANPYHYGHMPEVTVNADGTASIKKHFCMGRISHELVQVMPDQRTALMGDDATNSGYFVFVADKEKDLSSGTLYAAKVGSGFSIDPAANSAAPLTWIKLGSATSAEIEKLASSLKPTDIMSVTSTDPKDASYTKIVANGKTEWIKINPGMEKAAAFLETHRYAAFAGASLGFTKMEGTTVNAKDKIAYSALQNVQSSMVAGNAANVPGNGISVPKQLVAGAVMALNLRGGQKDTQGNTINSDWMPVDTKALLAGEDIAADALGNTANPNNIANPDNLKFSEKLRTLFIGEDSSQHVNNFLWAYNVDTKQLSRIMSVPAGGESTGLHAVDEINGFTYIMSNFQHAGDWGSIHSKVKDQLDPMIRANYKDKFGSAVGYLTGTPRQMKLVA